MLAHSPCLHTHHAGTFTCLHTNRVGTLTMLAHSPCWLSCLQPNNLSEWRMVKPKDQSWLAMERPMVYVSLTAPRSHFSHPATPSPASFRYSLKTRALPKSLNTRDLVNKWRTGNLAPSQLSHPWPIFKAWSSSSPALSTVFPLDKLKAASLLGVLHFLGGHVKY